VSTEEAGTTQNVPKPGTETLMRGDLSVGNRADRGETDFSNTSQPDANTEQKRKTKRKQ
jgi:hypothetical protein